MSFSSFNFFYFLVVTIFNRRDRPYFDPPFPLLHFVTHPGTPQSTSQISDLPRFLVGLVQNTRTKVPCTNSLSIVRGGFCPRVLSGGLLSGRFCPGRFLSIPPSVRIHL